MTRDINLNSEAWCNLIFKGKNKNYGAYQLRNDSNKRHIMAILISLFFVAAIILSHFLFATFKDNLKTDDVLIVDETVTVVIIDESTTKKIEPILVAKPEEKKFIASIKMIPPIAVDKELINKDATIHTNDEILSTNKAIAMVDVESDVKRKDGVIIGPNIPAGGDNVIIEEKSIFEAVEQDPDFPGGYSELMKFLGKNLRYPVPAIDQGVQGRVVVQFVVNKTGEISNVKILQSLHPLCDKEAERLIKSMPNWIPGKQNGNSVNVYYTIPIRFKLQER